MLSSHYTQRGVGMMEVLVSILIISVAVLGFIALQMRATVATEEAIKRSDALVILHGLAERIRLNSTDNYKITIPSTAPACLSTLKCPRSEQAKIDLYEQNQIAESKGLKLNVSNCANTSDKQERVCLIAAWNETEPTIGASTDEDRCLNSDGKYAPKSDCLVLEAY